MDDNWTFGRDRDILAIDRSMIIPEPFRLRGEKPQELTEAGKRQVSFSQAAFFSALMRFTWLTSQSRREEELADETAKELKAQKELTAERAKKRAAKFKQPPATGGEFASGRLAACDPCQAGGRTCDSARPRCANCTAMQATCVYQEEPSTSLANKPAIHDALPDPSPQSHLTQSPATAKKKTVFKTSLRHGHSTVKNTGNQEFYCCNYCNAKYAASSTTNIVSHLKHKHPDKLSEHSGEKGPTSGND